MNSINVWCKYQWVTAILVLRESFSFGLIKGFKIVISSRKPSLLKPYTVSSDTGDFWLTKGITWFQLIGCLMKWLVIWWKGNFGLNFESDHLQWNARGECLHLHLPLHILGLWPSCWGNATVHCLCSEWSNQVIDDILVNNDDDDVHDQVEVGWGGAGSSSQSSRMASNVCILGEV